MGFCTDENFVALEKLAMVEGESASIPWTHISHEELTYLLRKFFISNRNKVLNAYSEGKGWYV